MKSQLTGIVLALAATTVLGACASFSNIHEAWLGEGRLAQIRHGLTQDQVRDIAGKPDVVRAEPRLGETLWIYSFTDEWNYPSEFDVSFDRTGLVADVSTERLHY